MNLFQYTLLIHEIDSLQTKKAKKELMTTLLYKDGYYEFKALTYLLQQYPKDVIIGTGTSNRIKKTLHKLITSDDYLLDDLTEFCETPYTVSQYHFDHLASSRYTTYQMLAYVAHNIKVNK